MDSELAKYKKTMIEQIKQQYNYTLASLKQQLLNYINQINALNIHRNIKILVINNAIKNYNSSLAKVAADYTNKINNINSLTQLPVNKYALLIGINYINTQYQLSGCINDTTNIKQLLQDKFAYNNFNILTDLTVTKPSKQNIINSLTNLLVNCRKGDSLFFLYSGHGTCTVDLNGDETDGQDEMIVPLDGTSVSSCILDDELNAVIRKNLKEGVKLFMLFDSCFSGTVVDLKYNYLADLDSNVVINPNVAETVGQVIMISGCKDNQTSADTYINVDGQNKYAGAMSFSFLKTIYELGNKITVKTLLENMRTILKDNNYSQIPQLSSGTLVNINNVYIDF